MILPTRAVEKPWGRERLPAPFAGAEGKRIGEIWFEPPEAMPDLLVKYIFTSEKLSVQVHPSDAQTLAAGLGRQGKTECWLVLDAEPGATLGIGFSEPVDAPAMRQAAIDGSIEEMLAWHPVKAGDFFYIPANTVHAIGAGIALVEVQQNSDITYRLYDYGRPRPLHLDEGIAVASGERYPDRLHRTIAEQGEIVLAGEAPFRLVRFDGPLGEEAGCGFGHGPLLVLPLAGSVAVMGESIAPGACALAPALALLAIDEGARGLIAQPIAA